MERSELLLIGGRSGVGKSTAADALHETLVARDLVHAVIEGDALDLAHPTPWVAFPDAHLAERNLAAMWANYRELGFRRLVYTNTSSVVVERELVDAMGDDPRVTSVLLRSTDATADARLAHRRAAPAPESERRHSAETAVRLDAGVASHVHRVATDGLTPAEVAERILELTGWAP